MVGQIDYNSAGGVGLEGFQQGFNLSRGIQNAPYETQKLKAGAEDAQLTTASKKLEGIASLLNGVKDQNSYTMAKNTLAQAGIIKPQDVPDVYDPAYVDMHKNSLNSAKAQLDKQYKLAEIEQMKAGGATGTLLNRMNAQTPEAEALRNTYFGKANAPKGVVINPITGQAETVPGYNQAVAGTKAAEAKANIIGGKEGENENEFRTNLAALPQLKTTIKELSDLGKEATYTGAGRIYDVLHREVGAGEAPGAIAREAYINKVKDQVFPLLKSTFGSQFTRAEGDALLETLGDPNKGYEAKDAALKSFIEQKEKNIKTGKSLTSKSTPQLEETVNEIPGSQADLQAQSELGVTPSNITVSPSGKSRAPKIGEIVDNHVYLGGDFNNPKSWKVKR